MPKCRSCEHNVPLGTYLCPNCGAPLDIERDESPTSHTETGGDMEAEVLRLLEGGQKIAAVKLYKQQTGVRLSEAKQAVEALAASRGIVTKRGGCAGVLVVILVAAVVFGTAIQ